MKFRQSLLMSASVILLSSVGYVQTSNAEEAKWGPYLELEAKPGNNRTLGKIDVFAPLAQNADNLLFANIRGAKVPNSSILQLNG